MRRSRSPGGTESGPVVDRAIWTRVDGIGEWPLDLLDARIGKRHYAPHIHEEFAVGVCTDGVEVIRYRGERHYATPGTVVILEPGEAHTGGPATPAGFAYQVMYPHQALLSEGSTGHPHFRDPVVHDPELAEALRRLHLTLSRGTDALEAESRLSWLLAALLCRHAGHTAWPADEQLPALRRVRSCVMSWLTDQMTDPPALAEIAADLGLSRYQVLRAFRETVGMPPYAWLAQRRVARARVLLERGRPPAAAAALVGFADQAHLTRWLQRVLGIPPGAYRNSVQDSVRFRP